MKQAEIEIFEAGQYTEGNITEADLDEVVQSFEETDWNPPLIIGDHPKDEKGRPIHGSDPKLQELADGFIVSLKRDGKKLIGMLDITNPDYQKYWDEGRLLSRSASFWKKMNSTGKRGLRAVKMHLDSVAELGKTAPAVQSLTYKPAFQGSDADGQFVDYDMVGESATADNKPDEENQMDNVELVKENERLKAERDAANEKAEIAAQFAAESKEKDAEIERLRAEKVAADEKAALLEAEKQNAETKAQFASVEREVDEMIKKGIAPHLKDAIVKLSCDGEVAQFSASDITASDAVKTITDAILEGTAKVPAKGDDPAADVNTGATGQEAIKEFNKRIRQYSADAGIADRAFPDQVARFSTDHPEEYEKFIEASRS